SFPAFMSRAGSSGSSLSRLQRARQMGHARASDALGSRPQVQGRKAFFMSESSAVRAEGDLRDRLAAAIPRQVVDLIAVVLRHGRAAAAVGRAIDFLADKRKLEARHQSAVARDFA